MAAPPRTVNLPGHAGLFVGRGDELAELEAALRTNGEVVMAAVHGLGGVGKSTLAARYALAQAKQCNPVWKIIADSPTAVQIGLADLARALEPQLAAALPMEALAERAAGWLATHEGWLLVLDDVADPADVAPLLGRTLAGRVLVTSRLAEGWHRLGAQVLRLDVLGEQEAVDLVTRIATGLHPSSGAGAEAPEGLEGELELVRELGCLPLAIEQAGGYLHQAQLTPRTYLELLRQRPAEMYDRAARGLDAERTIARIWRITLDALADATPLAGDLLRILAWWAPDTIPRTLLDPLADPADLADALGVLAAYNMLTLTENTVTVHRLVQAVARTSDPTDPHRQATALAIARDHATHLLNQASPATHDHPARWPIWHLLLPHIDALADHTTLATDSPTTSSLLDRAATFMAGQGAVHRAVTFSERSLAGRQRVLGDDHPDTLTSRNNLAGAYRAWDVARATSLFERTLADRQRVLGDDHPDTLTSRDDLALTYWVAGDLARATPLFERTLADRQRVLGDDHPDTLTSRNNLALTYQAAGDLARATPLFEQTLTDFERVLGNDHPDTLTSRNNLGVAYRVAEDLARATPLLEQTLADRQRVLGDDHPDTWISRYDLAVAYRAAGDLARATPLFEQTLADYERVLGPDHPFTKAARGNLEGYG
ncbi:tetratricopeptide repeat protein [Nonomuraea sp. NPDC050451]|uniref:tetratricopeptide repeat protein n=1 Tax=Nonomuraea sp. NPDC050451 TaxID=3364364 RepID=UPI0037B567CB